MAIILKIIDGPFEAARSQSGWPPRIKIAGFETKFVAQSLPLFLPDEKSNKSFDLMKYLSIKLDFFLN